MAEKKQFNGDVFVEVVENFNKWETEIAGLKGEKIGAGLLAIHALYNIDETIVYRLMSATATVEDAVELILTRVSEVEIQRLMKPLTRKQRSAALKDAAESRGRVSRTK